VAIETTVVGAYPKPPEEGGTFTLRKTLHSIEKGDATPDDLQAARESLVREVIAEQEAAGVDLVTDGHVHWDDIVTPFARHMSGFEIGGLIRFFDNNVYYRRPVCTAPVEWRGPSSVEQWQFADSVANVIGPGITAFTGTFATESANCHCSTDEGPRHSTGAVHTGRR
jgi:5-methyltetrahydropteroyltriglutamate--homocysteine methyltransferase